MLLPITGNKQLVYFVRIIHKAEYGNWKLRQIHTVSIQYYPVDIFVNGRGTIAEFNAGRLAHIDHIIIGHQDTRHICEIDSRTVAIGISLELIISIDLFMQKLNS